MSVWARLGEFLSSVALNAFSSVVEAVRTIFEGDAQTRRRVAFSIAMIALSAKMARADGLVTTNEVQAFYNIFAVPEKEAANVARLYQLAQQDVAGFEVYARQLAKLCSDDEGGEDSDDGALLEDILDGLFYIATADGYVHENELIFLQRVAEIFGIDEFDFKRIAARHVNMGGQDPYEALEIERGISFQEARKKYRALVKKHHPDRAIAQGMPLEFIAIANHRITQINNAWAEVEKDFAQAARKKTMKDGYEQFS